MSGKGKVLKNTFLYTFSTLLVKAIGFILLPVYTLFLTPRDYGIINLINSFTQVAVFIIAFSLYSAVVRFYTDFKDEKEKLKRFYGTVIIFVSISGIIFINLGFIFHKLLISCFFQGIDLYPFVAIGLVTLTFVCLHTIHQNIMQGMQHGGKLTLINLVVFGLQVCLNLIFIVIFKLGAVGILLATMMINIGYFIFMLIDLIKNDLITFCLDLKILKEALKYSVPLMPHNLATHLASFASRVFLNNSGSLASVGLYSVATQFSIIIDTIQASVNRAFTPWFYEMMNEKSEENNSQVISLSRFLLILYCVLYMIIGLYSQEAIFLMTNERYIMAWTVIPVLVIAFSVKSIYYFYVSVLFYYKEAANKIFVASISGSLADIIIAYTLVPKYGMYGSAAAFLIAKIILVTIVILISRKFNDIGYRVSEMIRIIVPSLLFMIIGLYFSYTKYLTIFSWINFLYKIMIFLLYLAFIYLTNKKMIDLIIRRFDENRKLEDI